MQLADQRRFEIGCGDGVFPLGWTGGHEPPSEWRRRSATALERRLSTVPIGISSVPPISTVESWR
jgi:hypothetical protein